MKTALLLAAALALTSTASLAADAAAGKTVFGKCAICHSIGPGATNRVGPLLNDVLGRTAGTEAGYNYSPAMKAAGAGGLVWTPENLAKYLPAPKTLVPGNKMAFTGLPNPDDVQNVIAYIETFSPNYKAGAAAPAAPAATAAPATAPAQ